MADPIKADKDQTLTAEARELLRRAVSGDRSVLPQLREFLDARPDIWGEAGDLGLQAERAWAALVAGPNALVEEAVRRQIEALKEDLGRGAASPLERLLLDQIAIGWLQVSYAHASYAQARGQGLSVAQRDYLERRQNRAQARLVGSIKQLALVRKLLRPTPSALELAARLVPETSGAVGGWRSRCGAVSEGVPVSN